MSSATSSTASKKTSAAANKKTSAAPAAAVAAVAPTVAAVAAAPAEDGKKKRKAAAEVVAVKEEPVVSEPVVVAVKEEPVAEDKEEAKRTVATDLLEQAKAQIAEQIKGYDESIASSLAGKKRAKELLRGVIKLGNMANKKKNKRTGVSGFLTPVKISSQLAAFLDVPAGDLISRQEVGKRISVYVKANNLAKGKKITCDEKLAALLSIPADSAPTELTYFNMQKYMTQHYPKDAVVVAPVSA